VPPIGLPIGPQIVHGMGCAMGRVLLDGGET